MRKLFGALLGLVIGLTATQGDAQFFTPPFSIASAVSTCSYPLPNGSNTVVAAYGLRKLRSAYAGKAVNIIRASDSATTDIGFAGNNCDFDTASANTFCTSTTCKITKWYDQSGNTVDISQATGSKQPVLTFSCLGGYPCATFSNANSTGLTGTLGAGITSATYAVVADLTSTASSPIVLFETYDGSANATEIGYSTGTGGIFAGQQVGGVNTGRGFEAQSLNTWYGVIGTITNSLSSVYLNGTKGTDAGGSTLASVTGVYFGINGSVQGWNGSAVEAIAFAPSISISDSNTISQNQRTYWGLP